MKAFRVHEYGEAAKFIEDEVNKPSAKQGHVVIDCLLYTSPSPRDA